VGFVQIIRSIEDLLYEIMTWLVFYPRTLWEAIRRPLVLARYSDDEQDDAASEQYTETLSPPIFLMLTVLLAHLVEIMLGQAIGDQKGAFARMFAGSEEALLLVRSVLFAVYPMVFATTLLRQRNIAIQRDTLRGPFFAQCYLAAFYALIISVSGVMAKSPHQELQMAAGVLALLATLWIIGIEAEWFRTQLDIGRGRAHRLAFTAFIKASFINALLALAIAV
jgi:hypothetical protein